MKNNYYYPDLKAYIDRSMTFGHLLTHAVKLGLGKPLEQNGAKPSSWEMSELAGLIGKELAKMPVSEDKSNTPNRGKFQAAGTRKKDKGNSNSQLNNLRNWMCKNTIPTGKSWVALGRVLFPNPKANNALQWQDKLGFSKGTTYLKKQERRAKAVAAGNAISLELPDGLLKELKFQDFLLARSQIVLPDSAIDDLLRFSTDYLVFNAGETLGYPEPLKPQTVGQILFRLIVNATRATAARLVVEKSKTEGKACLDLFDVIDWHSFCSIIWKMKLKDPQSSLAQLKNDSTVWTAIEKLLEPIFEINLDEARIFFDDAFYSGWNNLPPKHSQTLAKLFANHSQEQADLAFKLHGAAIRADTQKPVASGRNKTGEPFSLRELYVDLPIYPAKFHQMQHKTIEMEKQHRKSLAEIIGKNIQNAKEKPSEYNPFWIIRGGPGSGKSTSVKHFMAELAALNDGRVACLYAALQHNSGFKSNDATLIFRGNYLSGFNAAETDILDWFHSSTYEHLVIALDGLDEIGHSPETKDEIGALGTIFKKLDSHTATRLTNITVVFAGRPEVFSQLGYPIQQDGFTYLMSGLCLEKPVAGGPQSQLEQVERDYHYDLRADWIKKFYQHALAIRPHNAVSIEDLIKDLCAFDALSAEPLLLYLLAKMRVQTGVTVRANPELTRNDIYSALIDAVRSPTHRDVTPLEAPFREGGLPDGEKFQKVLECLAICAWRSGTGRVASARAFLDEAEKSGLKQEAFRFIRRNTRPNIDDAHDGSELLSVFYFNSHQKHNTNHIEIEFTHKSFASYLVAKRLFYDVVEIAEYINTPFSPDTATIQNFINLISSGNETNEIFGFIETEAISYQRKAKNDLANDVVEKPPGREFEYDRNWAAAETVETLICLLFKNYSNYWHVPDQHALAHAPHWSMVNISVEFPHRAIAVLMAVWSSLISSTQLSGSKRYLPKKMKVDRLISFAISNPTTAELHSKNPPCHFVAKSLTCLDLSGTDFTGANLSGADFFLSAFDTGTKFQSTVLVNAEFVQTHLDDAEFDICVLDRAIFFDTGNFSIANSSAVACMVEKVKFSGKTFFGTDFSESHFHEVVFDNCSFERVKFGYCLFSATQFINCSFSLCDFDEVQFKSGGCKGGSQSLTRFTNCTVSSAFSNEIPGFLNYFPVISQ